ncbi:MAG: glycosyltransferase family 4 protein [Actinomycetota bacterium]|nr:glycosyltransferase family 4 protein [Actinomycetota bacterium]
MYRDLVLLLSTRWMFQSTIFHFHAGGLSQLYPGLPGWLKWAFRRAYYGADVGVRTSALAPDDPVLLHARRDVIAPYGVPDAATEQRQPVAADEASTDGAHCPPRAPKILFVGVLRESKGVLVMLEACAELRRRGHRFLADLVGEFSTRDFEQRTRRLVATSGLDQVVRFLGALTPDQKYQAFADSDIFCFPTFFESETFGVVLIEAMQFGLPIVATNWRGIPAVVTDGVEGYLVPVHDVAALVDRLDFLLSQPEQAASMGARGRLTYETEFTLGRYHQRIQALFDSFLVPAPA